MDLNDSPQEAAFRAEARAFLAEHAPTQPMPQYHKEFVEDERLVDRHRAWQRRLFDHGWGALTWPREYGGRGLGPIEQIVWNQELARVGLGPSLFLVGIGMAGPTIIAHGTDAQKKRYLEPLLRGDEGVCQLFSEPGAGSDLASLGTRAVRDGDAWIVSGQKTWCSGATWADHGILLTRTNPAAPKRAGITFFLVDMQTPGIEVRPLRQMTGDAHFNEVFLNDVRVPDANRLGEVDRGWKVASTTLMNERMAMAGADGLFAWEDLLEHARRHRGRIDGVTRDELARLYTWVKSLELLNARVVTKLGRGEMPAAESSVMKLAMVRIVSKGSELGLRLLGPDGLLRPGTWQHQWLFAPAFHLAGGTDEVQKTLAAERVLGLPAAPEAVSKDTPFEELPAQLMDLGAQTYVNLATFRRDGREVRTPVWVAPDGERLIVWTNIHSGKVKRVRNGSRVRLAACDVRGKLRGDWVEAEARVLEDPAERDRALEALFRKYGWQMQAARIGGTLSGRWKQRGALEIRLSAQ